MPPVLIHQVDGMACGAQCCDRTQINISDRDSYPLQGVRRRMIWLAVDVNLLAHNCGAISPRLCFESPAPCFAVGRTVPQAKSSPL